MGQVAREPSRVRHGVRVGTLGKTGRNAGWTLTLHRSVIPLGDHEGHVSGAANVSFHRAFVGDNPLAPNSQDFGYSLGVLHHVPDTIGAFRACVAML